MREVWKLFEGHNPVPSGDRTSHIPEVQTCRAIRSLPSYVKQIKHGAFESSEQIVAERLRRILDSRDYAKSVVRPFENFIVNSNH